MNPRITFLTLGVDDLERSRAFYRDGLGFPTRELSEPNSNTATSSSSTASMA